jgi:hypothetical protein
MTIFQRPIGQVLCVVESAGYVDNGGTQLHGRVAANRSRFTSATDRVNGRLGAPNVCF